VCFGAAHSAWRLSAPTRWSNGTASPAHQRHAGTRRTTGSHRRWDRPRCGTVRETDTGTRRAQRERQVRHRVTCHREGRRVTGHRAGRRVTGHRAGRRVTGHRAGRRVTGHRATSQQAVAHQGQTTGGWAPARGSSHRLENSRRRSGRRHGKHHVVITTANVHTQMAGTHGESMVGRGRRR